MRRSRQRIAASTLSGLLLAPVLVWALTACGVHGAGGPSAGGGCSKADDATVTKANGVLKQKFTTDGGNEIDHQSLKGAWQLPIPPDLREEGYTTLLAFRVDSFFAAPDTPDLGGAEGAALVAAKPDGTWTPIGPVPEVFDLPAPTDPDLTAWAKRLYDSKTGGTALGCAQP